MIDSSTVVSGGNDCFIHISSLEGGDSNGAPHMSVFLLNKCRTFIQKYYLIYFILKEVMRQYTVFNFVKCYYILLYFI